MPFTLQAFVARCRRLNVPGDVMAKFLAHRPVGALIHTYNGNSKSAHELVAIVNLCDDCEDAEGVPQTLRLTRTVNKDLTITYRVEKRITLLGDKTEVL